MTITRTPRQKPETTKRLLMWATGGQKLAAKLYVSKEAAEGCYRKTAKGRAS